MRIVLTLSSYANLTGSELYTYELAKELSKRGTHVTILANQIGGEILKRTLKYRKNISIYPFFDHPEIPCDLVISSQPLPTIYALRFFSKAVHMQVIHSLFSYEQPIIDTKIKQYIAVRPEIQDHWQKQYQELIGKTKVIWNGVDTSRFNENYQKQNHKVPITLFVGTADQLRRNVIEDLMRDAIATKTKLWLVLDQNPFGKNPLPDQVEVFDQKWEIENYVKQCDTTAGIFVGRTTIEGFMMGKPGLVYDVDVNGKITKKATYSVPENRDMFAISYMTDKIIETYTGVRYE